MRLNKSLMDINFMTIILIIRVIIITLQLLITG